MNAESTVARPRRGRSVIVAGTAVAAVAMLSAGCAAGRQAATANEVTALDGSNVTVGSVALRGLSIDAPTGNYYPAGSYPQLRLVLVNTGTSSDVLTGLTTKAAAGWGVFTSIENLDKVQAGAGAAGVSVPTPVTRVVIPAGNRVSFGVPDSSKVLALLKTTRALYPAAGVEVTFTFAREGSITATVPVQVAAAPGTQVVEAPSSADEG